MRDRTPLLELFGHPWAMREPEFRRVVDRAMSVESNPAGFSFLFEIEEEEDPLYELVGSVAVIRVRGALFRQATYFSRFFGDRTYTGIAECFKQALGAGEVEAIVFDIDSPGGDALGLSELSDLIYQSRDVKPITSVIRAMGASAAYFIASSAGRVVAAREAMVGSIGTVATFIDYRKLDERIGIKEIEIVSSQSPKKRPDPASDEGRAQIQVQVDDIAQVFVDSVARNRGVTSKIVLRDFGQGDMFVGQRALDAGLVDAIETLDEVIAAAANPRTPNSSTALQSRATEDLRMKTVEIDKVTAEWLRENRAEVFAAIRAEGERSGTEKGRAEAATANAAALDAARAEGKTQGAAAGAEAERERILGIEKVALAGHEELVTKMKADAKATPASVAIAIVEAEKKTRGTKLQQLKTDEDAVKDVTPSGDPVAEASGRELGKRIATMA